MGNCGRSKISEGKQHNKGSINKCPVIWPITAHYIHSKMIKHPENLTIIKLYKQCKLQHASMASLLKSEWKWFNQGARPGLIPIYIQACAGIRKLRKVYSYQSCLSISYTTRLFLNYYITETMDSSHLSMITYIQTTPWEKFQLFVANLGYQRTGKTELITNCLIRHQKHYAV